MATLLAHFGTGTASQAAQTATGNGTSVTCSGALRVLVGLRGSNATAFTAGAVAVEESVDDGTTWTAVADAVPLNTADGGAAAANPFTLPVGSNPTDTWLVFPHRDGQHRVRCRISTTITGGSLNAYVYPIGL